MAAAEAFPVLLACAHRMQIKLGRALPGWPGPKTAGKSRKFGGGFPMAPEIIFLLISG